MKQGIASCCGCAGENVQDSESVFWVLCWKPGSARLPYGQELLVVLAGPGANCLLAAGMRAFDVGSAGAMGANLVLAPLQPSADLSVGWGEGVVSVHGLGSGTGSGSVGCSMDWWEFCGILMRSSTLPDGSHAGKPVAAAAGSGSRCCRSAVSAGV